MIGKLDEIASTYVYPTILDLSIPFSRNDAAQTMQVAVLDPNDLNGVARFDHAASARWLR